MRTMIAVVALSITLVGCQKAPPPPLTRVVAAAAPALPSDPADAAWKSAPLFVAKLQLQDLVEPRQMQVTTHEVRVRAVHNGTRIAFLLEWDDATKNDTPAPSQFSDACAVQIPAKIAADVPAPQMGEPGKPVEITFWTANWQAIVDGRPDELTALYPHAQIDHYPFDAEKDSAAQKAMAARYAPARALGNTMAGPRTTSVQDLLAEGPGTIAPAKNAVSTGKGKRTAHGWSVVITRPLPQGLTPQNHSQVAFAVWEGQHEEVGARKMRTGWVQLSLQEK